MGMLGFEQAQARAWSRAEFSRAALYGSAIRIAAVTGSACAGLALALWMLGRDSLFAGVGLDTAIVIVAASVPFRVMLSLLRGLLVVGGETARSNVALAIGDLARTLTIVALALAGWLSVESVVAALWVAVLVPLALHARAPVAPQRPPPGLVAAQLRDGAVLSPYFVFLFLNLRLDVLFLAALATPREVGVYAVAVIFAELVWLVTDAVNTGARERQWGAEPRGRARRDSACGAHEPAARRAGARAPGDRRAGGDRGAVRRGVRGRPRRAVGTAAGRRRDGVVACAERRAGAFRPARAVNTIAFAALAVNVDAERAADRPARDHRRRAGLAWQLRARGTDRRRAARVGGSARRRWCPVGTTCAGSPR